MKYIETEPLPEPIRTWYKEKMAVGGTTIFDYFNKNLEPEIYEECRKEYVDHLYVSSVCFLYSVFLFPLVVELLAVFDRLEYTFGLHAISMILFGSLAAGHTAMKFNLGENKEVEEAISTAWVHTGAAFLIVGSHLQLLSILSPEAFFLPPQTPIPRFWIAQINTYTSVIYYWSPFALSLTFISIIMDLESID